jgi:hypothetical protein
MNVNSSRSSVRNVECVEVRYVKFKCLWNTSRHFCTYEDDIDDNDILRGLLTD